MFNQFRFIHFFKGLCTVLMGASAVIAGALVVFLLVICVFLLWRKSPQTPTCRDPAASLVGKWYWTVAQGTASSGPVAQFNGTVAYVSPGKYSLTRDGASSSGILNSSCDGTLSFQDHVGSPTIPVTVVSANQFIIQTVPSVMTLTRV